MFSRRLKTGYFALEGLNSFATVYYFYYLYFFMQKTYGFDNKANLLLASTNGATYALMAWFGGRFAQRYGYFAALKTGYSIMAVSLSLGLVAHSPAGHIAVMVSTVFGMSFTWPTLEALVSEGEPRAGLQHMVGVYNVIWAATAALGNFSGGAILQKLGFASLFWVPMAIHISQFGLTLWLQGKARSGKANGTGVVQGNEITLRPTFGSSDGNGHLTRGASAGKSSNERQNTSTDLPVGAGANRLTSGASEVARVAGVNTSNQPATAASPALVVEKQAGSELQQEVRVMDGGFAEPGALTCRPIGRAEPETPSRFDGRVSEVELSLARKFLRMAWLANPFAYIAINTLIAVVPGVAHRLELSTMAAGFCCSTWCFARLGAFAFLWRWPGWHYRFRWLLLAYLGLVGSFGAIVLAPNVTVLVCSQLVFGTAVGLLYYSSLFYSMDRSETKGEHGGIHEAVIGLGNCAGPAVGALALQVVPQYSQSGTVAVTTLLLCGLGGLVGIWRTKAR